MKSGKQENPPRSNRTPYTSLPNIEEEGADNDHGHAGTTRRRRKINWKRILLKGLKYILLLSLMVGVGFGAVAMKYHCVFTLGL